MKKGKYLLLILIVSSLILFGVSFSLKIKVKEFSNNDFKINYDTTWKIVDKNEGVKLIHKKSDGIINIQCKYLEKNYIDTSLNDLIFDIKDSIEEQNRDYKLINKYSDFSNYETYSYLYEKDNYQTLVRICKKDDKLIIIYYEISSEYYDIVLDSAENIFESLEILTGELIG